ncbi:MAG TPA: hypothetical protein VG274_03640 [Rhizomicrobium sp.]|jgi:hypothetical protein|nr:hypothetical protein [Rhizomicrobium sp.]
MTRQYDLLLSDAEPEGFEDAPERTYAANPDRVRAHRQQILGEARAADNLPWKPKTVALYRTIFPQMIHWLP